MSCSAGRVSSVPPHQAPAQPVGRTGPPRWSAVNRRLCASIVLSPLDNSLPRPDVSSNPHRLLMLRGQKNLPVAHKVLLTHKCTWVYYTSYTSRKPLRTRGPLFENSPICVYSRSFAANPASARAQPARRQATACLVSPYSLTSGLSPLSFA